MKAKAAIALIVVLVIAFWILKSALKLAFFATKWILILAIILVALVWIGFKTSRRRP